MQEIPFSGKNLNELAAIVLNVFRSHGIDLYPDELLLKDLGRLTIVEKSYGYRLEATRDADGHADRATALALAMLVARTAPVSSGFGWGGTQVVNLAPGPPGCKRSNGFRPVYGEAVRKSPF
jgi:phage FluMu gp28-like protein